MTEEELLAWLERADEKMKDDPFWNDSEWYHLMKNRLMRNY